jgi:hypothetical protein
MMQPNENQISSQWNFFALIDPGSVEVNHRMPMNLSKVVFIKQSGTQSITMMSRRYTSRASIISSINISIARSILLVRKLITPEAQKRMRGGP